MTAPLTRDQFLDEWSRQHSDIEPRNSRLLRAWLAGVYFLSIRLVWINPNALTVLAVVVAIAVAFLSWVGGAWLLLAAALCGVTGILDSLDGGVAVVSGQSSTWGFVLDSVADRCSEIALFVALGFVGVPWVVVVALVASAFLVEYTRARASIVVTRAGSVVTIAERPTRIACVAAALVLAWWAPFGVSGVRWANVVAGVLVAAQIFAFVYLLAQVKRMVTPGQ